MFDLSPARSGRAVHQIRIGAVGVAAVSALAVGATRSSSSPGAAHWIAFHADPGSSGDLYLDSEDGSRRRRLTRFFGQVPTASWSPEGTRFALLARPHGTVDVYVIGADGRGLRQLTRNEGDHFGIVSWSPNGRRLAFTCGGEGQQAIYLIGADGSGRKRLVDNVDPAWSSDDRRMTFTPKRDGRAQIYVLSSGRLKLAPARCGSLKRPEARQVTGRTRDHLQRCRAAIA